jgi:hypothetical protein
MGLLEDPCGFLTEPVLAPLMYSTGQPVMRGDVQLLYYVERCGFIASAAGGKVIWIQPLYPDSLTDAVLKGLARVGHPSITDLASIPAFARSIFPPNGRYLKPALKHDHGYASAGYEGRASRAQVDAELLADMKAVGCSFIERQAIYRAVRLGGGAGFGH